MNYTYILNGLDCANCAAKIEESIKKIDGITNVSVNFITTKLNFACEKLNDDTLNKIRNVINKIEDGIEMEEY